jgi:predicted ferric reductase
MKSLRLRVAPNLGATVLVGLAVGYAALWLVARPQREPAARFFAELCGAEALFLMASSLVLAAVFSPVERAFGGLDRVAVWHKRVATTAVLLLVPHVALVTSAPDPYETSLGHALGDVALVGLLVLTVWALAPKLRAARWPGPIRRLARASYERWLTAHRLTGLFVAVAVVHGALVDPVLHDSDLLKAAYLVVGAIGIAAYLYRELLARFFIAVHDYYVAEVQRPNETTLEVSLEPVNSPLVFAAGQFVFLAFGGPGAWQRHPFSVASAPSDRQLEVSIKAAGDYTRDLHDMLETGTPAKVAGPFGGFDYRRGGEDQIWIAGGIGVTPFLSWIRSLDDNFDLSVDFFYSVGRESTALYRDEIEAATARHPTLHLHMIDTEHDGLITAEKAMNGRQPGSDVWVYMCGPPPMMTALADGFRRLEIPASRVRWEQFDIR